MRAFPSRFQLGDEFFRIRFPWIIERCDCPSAKITDGPDNPHSRPGDWFGSLRRFSPGARGSLLFGLRRDSHRFRSFSRGPQLSSIQSSSSHGTIVQKNCRPRQSPARRPLESPQGLGAARCRSDEMLSNRDDCQWIPGSQNSSRATSISRSRSSEIVSPTLAV